MDSPTPSPTPNQLSVAVDSTPLVLSSAFVISIFPLLIAMILLPVLRAQSQSSKQSHPRLATPLVLLSLVCYGVAGICAIISLSTSSTTAGNTFGAVLLLLAQLSLDASLLLRAFHLIGRIAYSRVILGLLATLLVLATGIHLVLIASPPKNHSLAIPAFYAATHVIFDLIFSAILLVDLRTAVLERFDLPTTKERTQTPVSIQPHNSNPLYPSYEARPRRFSNPWKPPSILSAHSGHDGTSKLVPLLTFLPSLRSSRLFVLQVISIVTFVAAVCFPVWFDYSTITFSGHVMPSIFGTTSSPAGLLTLAILALVRWSGLALDLTIQDGPVFVVSPSPPPSPHEPLRSFTLQQQTTPSRRLPFIHDFHSYRHSASHASTTSRTNTTPSRRLPIPSFGGGKSSSIPSPRVPSHQSPKRSLHGSRSSQTSSSVYEQPPSLSAFPPRIETPPNLGALGITITSSPAPEGISSNNSRVPSAGGGSDRSKKTKRPSILHLSTESHFSHSPTLGSFDTAASYIRGTDRGMSTPNTPRTPRRRERDSVDPGTSSSSEARSPIELDVEGGDPFAREPSAEALVEMWRRLEEKDGITRSPEFSGSARRELEDVIEEAGRSSGSDSEPIASHNNVEFSANAYHLDKDTEIVISMKNRTPSPPPMEVRIIAATPNTTPPHPASAGGCAHLPSAVEDPFPAPVGPPPPPPVFNLPRPPPQAHDRPSARVYQSAPPGPAPSPWATPQTSPTRPSLPNSPSWSKGSASISSFNIKRIMKSRSRRDGSRDSGHSDKSFTCIGDREQSFSPPGGSPDMSEQDQNHLERLQSFDETDQAGRRQLRLPSLFEGGDQKSASNAVGAPHHYRQSSSTFRKEKKSWWKAPAIRHSTSYPSLKHDHRAPTSMSVDWTLGLRGAGVDEDDDLLDSRSPTPRPMYSSESSNQSDRDILHVRRQSGEKPYWSNNRQFPKSSPPSTTSFPSHEYPFGTAEEGNLSDDVFDQNDISLHHGHPSVSENFSGSSTLSSGDCTSSIRDTITSSIRGGAGYAPSFASSDRPLVRKSRSSRVSSSYDEYEHSPRRRTRSSSWGHKRPSVEPSSPPGHFATSRFTFVDAQSQSDTNGMGSPAHTQWTTSPRSDYGGGFFSSSSSSSSPDPGSGNEIWSPASSVFASGPTSPKSNPTPPLSPHAPVM